MTPQEFASQVDAVLADLGRTLRSKNLAYGDAVLDPIRCLSKASPHEQLLVRMDDKLSRLVRGDDAGEDTLRDLVGYWVLLQIAQGMDSP